jgi:transcriptional repressor NrdR
MGPDYVERIKEIKSERKMTNEALSNLSGIPLGTLSKLLAGIIKACQKRPVDSAKIANKVESDIINSLRTEITSTEIGEMAMQELRKADPVAYIRFVSVYREFSDIDTFMAELKKFL